MENRTKRINDLIQEEVGKIILREIDFSRRCLITVTRVETASNNITTKVFISVLPENQKEKVMLVLNRKIYEIQQFLNKALNMRPIPKIIFYKEDKTSDAAKVEEVLEELKKD